MLLSRAAAHNAMTDFTLPPLAAWRAEVAHGALAHDAAQEQTAAVLDGIHHALVAAGGRSWLAAVRRRKAPVPGAYLWGGVGRGKTHLMDLFHRGLPFADKRRLHFHRFMEMVHAELKMLVNRRDPLAVVAGKFARNARVLCFDEFSVSDIGDAMILSLLLGALFERGVTLVATSNTEPDELYKNGLQRDRFLPAIALIKRHTRVVHLDGGADYRLRALDSGGVYHVTGDGDHGDAALLDCYRRIAGGEGEAGRVLHIRGRPLRSRRRGDGIAWFTFTELCAGPRGIADYIALARLHHTLLVSAIPRMDADHDDRARRFIALVDELYERGVNLIASAHAEPENLYHGRRLKKEFARAASRLREMQSREYLARRHRG